MNDTITYPYKPKLGMMALVVLFFGAGALFMRQTAETNEQGLILNHIFEFSTDGATTFYWVVAAICAFFAVVGMAGLFSALSVGENATLRLTPIDVHVPHGFLLKETRTIPFSDITRLGLAQVSKQRFLTIHHAGTKTNIAESNLSSAQDFEQICTLIAARTQKNRF